MKMIKDFMKIMFWWKIEINEWNWWKKYEIDKKKKLKLFILLNNLFQEIHQNDEKNH